MTALAFLSSGIFLSVLILQVYLAYQLLSFHNTHGVIHCHHMGSILLWIAVCGFFSGVLMPLVLVFSR